MAETLRIEIPVEMVDKTEPELSNLKKKIKKLGDETEEVGKKSKKSQEYVTAFDRSSQKTQKSLAKWAKEKYEVVLEAKDKVSSMLSSVGGRLKSYGSKTWSTTLRVLDAATTPIKKVMSVLTSLKTLFLGVAMTMATNQLIINPIVNYADAYESASIGFETLLGKKDGQRMMDDIDEFAAKTPFKTSAVTEQAQKMLAMGWNSDDIINDMYTIGDAAAATGKGEEGLQRIALALSQIKSKGKMSSEELNQLAEAGISAKRYLAEGLGYGSGDAGISKLSKALEDGEVMANEAIDAILKGMDEYDGMMEKTANSTVTGLGSQIADAFEINVIRKWGQGLQEGAIEGMKYLNELLDSSEVGLESIGDKVYTLGKELSEWAAVEVKDLTEMIMDIISSDDFANASAGGKVKLLFDKLIGEPVADWWNNDFKPHLGRMIGDIGKSIGTGLSNGILFLLGIDIDETANEGASIGLSFAKGFAEGFDFDMVSKKLWDGFVNLFDNASKLLPGGESADLGSLLSLGILTKVLSPVLSLGKGAFGLGKSIFGIGNSALFKSLLGSTGNAMVGGSGILGKLADIGYSGLRKSNAGAYFGDMTNATSGNTAALAGAGAVTGGVIGGATLISGGMDLYKATTIDDVEGSDAYARSGVYKIGGVAAGAGIGTAILPGIGTAIGAGIGGIVGWIAGESETEEYEEKLRLAEEEKARAEKAFQATGRSMDELKFKNKTLRDALKDTEVSAEDFATMFKESIDDVSKARWGNIKLSLKEIQEVANKLVFDNGKESLVKFNEAIATANNSFESLQSHIRTLDKMNWKVSLGLEFDSSEKEEYIAAAEELITEAKTYIEDKQYSVNVAIELLMGSEGKGLALGLDSTYAGIQAEAEKLGTKLRDKIQESLENGVISLDENTEIMNLQQQIANIVNELNNANVEASFDALSIKYGGRLSADSFAQMQEEMATLIQEGEQGYDEALVETIKNLNIRKERDPKYTDEQYQKDKKAAEDAYKEKVKMLYDQPMDYQMGNVIENYEFALREAKLPGTGSIEDKLKTAYEKAVSYNPDVSTWTQSDVVDWFGLNNLDASEAGSLAEYLTLMANSIPQSVKDDLHARLVETIPTVNEIIASTDFSWTPEQIKEWFNIEELASQEGIEIMDLFNLSQVSSKEGASARQQIAEKLQEVLTANPEMIESFNTFLKDNMWNPITGGVADSFGEVFGQQSVSMSQNAWTAFTSEMTKTFSTPYTVTPTVNIKPKMTIYPSGNVTPTKENTWSVGNTFSFPASIPVQPANRYNGGYVGHKQLSWLAEEGYGEFVIPTNPSRRARALDLYKQAGRALGVGEYAEGGFVGRLFGPHTALKRSNLNSFNENEKEAPTGYNESTDDNYSPVVGETGKSGSNVQVTVSMAPSFTISGGNGQSEEDVVNVVKRHIKEMADEIGGEIAIRLEEVFSNMPLEEA